MYFIPNIVIGSALHRFRPPSLERVNPMLENKMMKKEDTNHIFKIVACFAKILSIFKFISVDISLLRKMIFNIYGKNVKNKKSRFFCTAVFTNINKQKFKSYINCLH